MMVLAGVLYVLGSFLTWHMLDLLDEYGSSHGSRLGRFSRRERMGWAVLWWAFALVFIAAETHAAFGAKP